MLVHVLQFPAIFTEELLPLAVLIGTLVAIGLLLARNTR